MCKNTSVFLCLRDWYISSDSGDSRWLQYNGRLVRKFKHRICYAIRKMRFKSNAFRAGNFGCCLIFGYCFDIILMGFSNWHMGSSKGDIGGRFVWINFFIYFCISHRFSYADCISFYGRCNVSTFRQQQIEFFIPNQAKINWFTGWPVRKRQHIRTWMNFLHHDWHRVLLPLHHSF